MGNIIGSLACKMSNFVQHKSQAKKQNLIS